MRRMLDALPDCVKIFDAQGKLIYINPAGLRMSEAPDLETLNRSGHRCVAPEFRSECARVHDRVLNGESVVWTYDRIGMAGGRRSVEANVVPFSLPGGAIGVLSLSRDITERAEIENALRRSEDRLRLVQEASGLAAFENDGSEMTVCTDLFFQQVGLPAGDNTISIWEWMDLVHPDDRDQLWREMEQARLFGDDFDFEYRIIRRDNGDIRWISCRTKMMRNDDGQLIRTIGAHRDITARKTAEIALQEREQRLRLVQTITGLGEFWAEEDGLAHLSDRVVEQLGLPSGTKTLAFDELLQLIHPQDRIKVEESIKESLTNSDTVECEFRVIHPETGAIRWIHSRTRMLRDESGRIVRNIGAHLDITDRKNVEQVLRESEERFRLAAEAAGLGVWDFDPAKNSRQWSPRVVDILGLPKDTEATLEAAAACIHPSDRANFLSLLNSVMADTASVKFEATFRVNRPDNGEERWITANCWKPQRAGDQTDRVILTLRDVTAEKSAERRIRWTASHDPLTRVANRSQFHERLDAAIQCSKIAGQSVGLILLDLDHFKQINDTLGHDAGDALLKMFADRLGSVVRQGDIVARLGGDEFAIILADVTEPLRLSELAHSIEQRLREPFLHKGHILDCYASLGGAIFPADADTPAELMKCADIALYAAKDGGRANTKIYHPALRDQIDRRTHMVQLARDAIKDHRIVPYYQPKFDLHNRAIVGFEALLRWHNPEGELQFPEQFEAAFEDLNVAAQLTDRMVEQVIADMQGWMARGLNFGHVAVNTSAADYRREMFAQGVLQQISAAGIPTAMFQIEVTENVFLGRGAEYVLQALQLFCEAGVKIALDDFGTGYASLRHLKDFPVDIIKIDRSFVHGMATDPGDDAIVHAVINLGKSLGIEVVAEGIEVECQVQHLLRHGCRYGQGFLITPALPAAEVPALLNSLSPVGSCPEPRTPILHRKG